jgi:hypothetical protein
VDATKKPLVQRLKWYLVVLLLGPVLGTIVHEAAHLLMQWITGSTVEQIVILGRLQLWPAVAIIENTHAGFMIKATNPDAYSYGMVLVTGASSTFCVALAAIPWWLRTRSKVALIFVFWSLDIITYLTLPSLGVRRWILFGAPYSEMLEGLEFLEVPRWITGLFELAFIVAAVLLFRASRATSSAGQKTGQPPAAEPKDRSAPPPAAA